MAYIFRGKLCGLICPECPESLANVIEGEIGDRPRFPVNRNGKRGLSPISPISISDFADSDFARRFRPPDFARFRADFVLPISCYPETEGHYQTCL